MATTVSDETRRAQAAAARAADDLVSTRRHTKVAAASADQLEEANRHNGFYLLIRNALGAG